VNALARRFDYLFHSTRGLVLVAIAFIGLVTAIFGTLSGPMADLGLKDISVRVFGTQLVETEREARIIMLYHTIAMAVIAIETYFITAIVPMKKSQQTNINAAITVGYITSLVFGLLFAYFGRNFIFHGLFIFGQSLIFFAGLLLAKALWPWGKELPPDQPGLCPHPRRHRPGARRLLHHGRLHPRFRPFRGDTWLDVRQRVRVLSGRGCSARTGQDGSPTFGHRPSPHHADAYRSGIVPHPRPMG
jgi:hypothetical protein